MQLAGMPGAHVQSREIFNYCKCVLLPVFEVLKVWPADVLCVDAFIFCL